MNPVAQPIADVTPALDESTRQARESDEADTLDMADAPVPTLIEHILKRYHDVHRAQLPELISLASHVEQVHDAKPECPAGLAEHLHYLHQALESHMQKEERVLFPILMSHRDAGRMVAAPIRVLRHEHDEHGVSLRKLEALTSNITPPPAACDAWQALYQGLRAFRRDLMRHIHLENDVLFERFAPVGAHRTGDN